LRLPVASRSARRIPELVRTGEVSKAEPAKNGSPQLRCRAVVDGAAYGCIAEVRAKKRRLDTVTFYRSRCGPPRCLCSAWGGPEA
jgi:hypothetical protein